MKRARLVFGVLLGLALGLALSLASMGASCHKATPRHDSAVNAAVLVTSLHALQDGELTLYRSGMIAALTPARHRAFSAQLVKVYDATDAAVVVLQTWRPGEPIPAQLPAMLAAVRTLLTDAATAIGQVLPAEVGRVWDALTGILAVIGGVL